MENVFSSNFNLIKFHSYGKSLQTPQHLSGCFEIKLVNGSS